MRTEAYYQTGTGPVPDLWRRAGEKCELSTGQPRTEPHRDRRLIAEMSFTPTEHRQGNDLA